MAILLLPRRSKITVVPVIPDGSVRSVGELMHTVRTLGEQCDTSKAGSRHDQIAHSLQRRAADSSDSQDRLRKPVTQ